MSEALPEVLLPYQVELIAAMEDHPVVVVEKSRRIGMTWAVGSKAVLTAAARRDAGGMDVLYIGYNLDMAREFVDCCAMWATGFERAASEVQEFLFVDKGGGEPIQAFRVRFASGHDIVALTSRPRSLRGRQGLVIIDEAAFHDALEELLKAALALLIWGGGLLVISTHDGVDNPFCQLVEDCRSGRRPFEVLRTTFDEALEQGLYKRISMVTGEAWTPEREKAWRDEIVARYGDAADEELHCIPRQSGGAWLSRALIEARMVTAPVLRWTAPDGFDTWPEHLRFAEVDEWLRGHVLPLLGELDERLPSGFGMDFGRSGDLSVIAPYQTTREVLCRVPFMVELRNVPFRQQEQILFFLVDRLPRMVAGALDARGNGQYLAEVAAQRYGSGRVEQVMLSEGWYREHTAPFKAAFEDGTIELPRDLDVMQDLRAFEVVRGVPRVPDKRRAGRDGGQRHGDAGVALLLMHYASRRPGSPIEFEATGQARTALQLGGYHDGRVAVGGGLDLRGW